ncbi:MAG: hypothetical protein Kow006_30810 [Gammaproteobacteria bacterium]
MSLRLLIGVLARVFPQGPEQITAGEERTSHTITFTGELGTLGYPVFLDSDALENWTVYGVGLRVIKQGGNTIFDYGATPSGELSYKTIGGIRGFIAAENAPGFKDAIQDFTGFWKECCDQGFGWQIKQYEDEGKYAVVFCGPGGCGDPSEERLTFITGLS